MKSLALYLHLNMRMEIFFGFTIDRLDIEWYEPGPLDMLSKVLDKS
jgi:hypothetical protein